MSGYWFRRRLLSTVIICVAVSIITILLFVFPHIEQLSNDYNSQSIYKNTDIDFIAPEPSFEQIRELPGTNGIEKVFPFYLTKTEITVGKESRTTTVLMSDQLQNIDITMYNDSRLIKKSDHETENPIFVDWQFCKDTSSDVGDTVSLTIGDKILTYTISAVYETNNIYDGGAVLIRITEEQRKAISARSKNNGYSGVYISANDYNICQSYLTNKYRPLGRLKSRDQFEDEKQYQIHYDAIMSSNYANEITDFRIRQSNQKFQANILLILAGSVLSAVILIGFNIIMSNRGCEKIYFQKNCIPKGQNVRPYYIKSFIAELILTLGFSVILLLLQIHSSEGFIPSNAIKIELFVVPAAILIAEIICLIINSSKITKYTKIFENEKCKKAHGK